MSSPNETSGRPGVVDGPSGPGVPVEFDTTDVGTALEELVKQGYRSGVTFDGRGRSEAMELHIRT